MKKIAFCFLIYDKINHEYLWKLFFNNIDPNKYNIYIHYKYDKPLKYFEKYKLNNCVSTKWGDISLVIAQNMLLKEAIKDKNNKHMVFISNSCVPLKPFNHIYNLLDHNYSYFKLMPINSSFPRCNKTLQYIDKKYIKKSSQWCILNRKHSNIFINSTDYLHWFNYEDTIPDEHCYITKLYYEGLQNELIINTEQFNSTTFTNWSHEYNGYNDYSKNLYKYNDSTTYRLKNYNSISKSELLYLLNSKSLFGRKFTIYCFPYLYIKEYINHIKSNNVIDSVNITFYFSIFNTALFLLFIILIVYNIHGI